MLKTVVWRPFRTIFCAFWINFGTLEEPRSLGGVWEGSGRGPGGVILGAGAPGASGRSGSIKVAPLSNGMRAFPENVDFMKVCGGRCHQVPIFTIQTAHRQRSRLDLPTIGPLPTPPGPLQLALFGELDTAPVSTGIL